MGARVNMEGKLQSGNNKCAEVHKPTVLDNLLDSVFGRSFTSVLEFESMNTLGTDLQCAMRTNPLSAYNLLRRVFLFEEAVDAVLANVSGRMARLEDCPEHNDLRVLLLSVVNSRSVPSRSA